MARLETDDETLPHNVYKSFDEFVKRITLLKAPQSWKIAISSALVSVTKADLIHILPMFEIHIVSSLTFTIRVFTWKLPDSHNICVQYSRSVMNITSSNIILSNSKLCQSVVANSNRFIKHIVPKIYNPSISVVTQQTEYNRSPSCVLLQSTDADVCTECKIMEQFENATTQKAMKRKAESLTKSAKPKAPISLLHYQNVLN